MKKSTLLFVIKDKKLLLGMKKRGFGIGRWNGFGGKVLDGETIEEATVRETQEESGIAPINMRKIGILDFEFKNKSEWNQQVHFFQASEYEGDLIETEEMRPQWFGFGEIPLEKMWPDDKFWIPLMLEGKKFTGRFVFGEGDVILEHEIKEIEKLHS